MLMIVKMIIIIINSNIITINSFFAVGMKLMIAHVYDIDCNYERGTGNTNSNNKL